jgi:TonB-dependent receptor
MNKLTGILTVIIFFSSVLLSSAQVITLKEKISIDLKNTTAAEVIEELDKRSDYTFSYTRGQLEKISIKSFVFTDITLGNALESLQRMANLEFNLLGNTIAVKINQAPVATPASKSNPRPGKITGVIRNEKNEEMPGVTVLAESVNKSTTTSVSGDYVLTLPPGTYTLEFSFVGYQTKRVTDAVVKDGEITDLSAILSAASKQMQAVVVTSGARKEGIRSLLMAQKNNASMTNGISAEQIRVTPDNNTAQVLKRVSGITVQGEKFVTIRGVSDRYNNVLINGATLPSTEPNRRNFSFDIVPSAMVDNIIVNKTASPDLPGEFTGGLIQINTKDVPAQNFLEFTIGTGFNSASSGKDFMSLKRDEKALLGKVDEDRRWFGDGKVFDPVAYTEKVIRGKDTAYRNMVGGKIPNRWQPYTYKYTPVQNYQLTGGLNKRFTNGSSVGMVGALTYRNELTLEEGETRVLQQADFESQRFRYNTTIGALLNIAYKSKHHKLAWKNLYNHKYSNQFDQQTGAYIGQGWYGRRRGEVTLTNDMLFTRLEGEHVFGVKGIKIDWFADNTQLTREQPDTRFLTGNSGISLTTMDAKFIDKGKYMYIFNFPLLTQSGLYSSTLEEKRKNAGGNFSFPFTIAGEKQLFKAGYLWSERKADFDGTGLIVRGTDAYTLPKLGLPYHEIATPEAFANGSLDYFTAYVRSETTGDRYEGTQNLQGWYGMLDLKLLKKLRLTGGLRYEDNKMKMATVFYSVVTGLSEFRDTVYREKDWLPSVNLIYSLNDKFNIRGAFSKTLARPDFVERSPYIYYDFVELTQVIGQNGLEISRIKNYDLRFEYYPTGNEILSASVFYKDFDKPVERFYNIGSSTNSVEYKNLYSATAKGFEIDARKSLAFINPGSRWLQNLYISGNFTYLKGEISYIVNKVPGTQKDTFFIAKGNRPIQGLSPYIINGGLNYQSKIWGFNIAYNRFGRRIVNGGTNQTLIQYENPRSIVDIQLSTKVMKQKGEIKFNISDLLNQYYIIYSNNENRNGTDQFPGEAGNADPKKEAFNEDFDFVNYKVKKGTSFSINFSYRL